MRSIWRVIEASPPSAAAVAWRQWFGPGLTAAAGVCLRGTEQRVERVPCPNGCGCGHRVLAAGSGFVGVCDCGDECEDLKLTAEDVLVWQVSLDRLGRAVAKALDCEVKLAELGLPDIKQIGSLAGEALPILLTVQRDQEGMRNAVAQVIARLQRPFVLLAPTNQFLNAYSQGLLASAKAEFVDLERHVEVLASGALHAPKSAGELFAAFLPERKEAITESEGRRIFELFTKLATGKGVKKAPLDAVFRHTVLEGHSQKKTARLCGCVPALISRRVKTIEDRFQMPIERLRNFASTILEIETSVKGGRTVKKKHGAPEDKPPEHERDSEAKAWEDDDGFLPEERQDYG